MRNQNARRALLLVAALFMLTACAMPTQSRTPYLDSRFGESVEMARAQQTLNPNASQNTDPVTGVDGRAAHEAIGRYEASFARPPAQTNMFSIGVSGSGSGGGGVR
jgi:uncharacterized lipoprotein YajG